MQIIAKSENKINRLDIVSIVSRTEGFKTCNFDFTIPTLPTSVTLQLSNCPFIPVEELNFNYKMKITSPNSKIKVQTSLELLEMLFLETNTKGGVNSVFLVFQAEAMSFWH